MDALPDEILVYLFSFLTPQEIATTQLVSRQFLRIGRDNNLWRDECFEISRFLVNLRRRNREKPTAATSTSKPHFEGQPGDATEGQLGDRSVTLVARHDWHSSNQRAAERIRMMANWDPSYQAEKIDWYTEYIHRTAPISVRWFQRPLKQGGGTELPLEVRGIGTHYLPGSDDVEMTIAPVEDGSVCIWDVKGSIIGRSAERSLRSTKRRHAPHGIVDAVSVNSDINRAFIAVEHDLMEVDLHTLQTVSQTRYPSPISAISEARGSTPMTVGTDDGLHLHDPRSHNTSPREDSPLERLEGDQYEAPVFRIAPGLQMDYSVARSTKTPVALSILHMFNSGEDTASDIFVAGRFTCIMNYDRRFLSRPRSIIHSGARLSSMTYIPYSFSKDASASMRHSELSVGEVRSVKSTPGNTLIACGEYAGRGSLDLYGVSEIPNAATTDGPVRTLQSAFKNRLTSSTSIILSVVPHGSRLVFSDGNGNLKWVERDGFTEVRQWNISHEFPDNRPGGIFGDVDTENENSVDIARKLLPTRKYGAPAAASMDNLLMWTGEKIGLVRFSNKQNSGSVDFEEVAKSLEERGREDNERTYRELTRRALVAQADEHPNLQRAPIPGVATKCQRVETKSNGPSDPSIMGAGYSEQAGNLTSQSPVVYIAVDDKTSHFMYFSLTDMHQAVKEEAVTIDLSGENKKNISPHRHRIFNTRLFIKLLISEVEIRVGQILSVVAQSEGGEVLQEAAESGTRTDLTEAAESRAGTRAGVAGRHPRRRGQCFLRRHAPRESQVEVVKGRRGGVRKRAPRLDDAAVLTGDGDRGPDCAVAAPLTIREVQSGPTPLDLPPRARTLLSLHLLRRPGAEGRRAHAWFPTDCAAYQRLDRELAPAPLQHEGGFGPLHHRVGGLAPVSCGWGHRLPAVVYEPVCGLR
ncbi:hypothetical protein V492_03306 [Pseudogymnoascus sp. VKM F-4246]|nr:hypothetical protein V492_03306 [Pseudogymnoascus sp. VKM F-4246]